MLTLFGQVNISLACLVLTEIYVGKLIHTVFQMILNEKCVGKEKSQIQKLITKWKRKEWLACFPQLFTETDTEIILSQGI